jgi:hypothetical protein
VIFKIFPKRIFKNKTKFFLLEELNQFKPLQMKRKELFQKKLPAQYICGVCDDIFDNCIQTECLHYVKKNNLKKSIAKTALKKL